MFGLFKKDPLKKLEQAHEDLATRAFLAQRNGDIRSYSTLTAEADSLRKEIEALKSNARD